jgi:opacity protein-like surface antigen
MRVRSISIVIAVPVISAAVASAQDWTQNLYVGVDAGYMYQQDTTLDFSAINISSSTSSSGNISFQSGMRADVTAGYNLNRSWAVEFDTGVLWSSSDYSPLVANLNTYTVPLIANIIYKIPIKGPWSSYIGAGGGGAASIFSYKYNPSGFTADDYNFVFGYQAEFGLKYALTRNASLGIAYNFFGTTNPSWQFTEGTSTSIPPATTYHFTEKGFYTHSLVLSFTWNF